MVVLDAACRLAWSILFFFQFLIIVIVMVCLVHGLGCLELSVTCRALLDLSLWWLFNTRLFNL